MRYMKVKILKLFMENKTEQMIKKLTVKNIEDSVSFQKQSEYLQLKFTILNLENKI